MFGSIQILYFEKESKSSRIGEFGDKKISGFLCKLLSLRRDNKVYLFLKYLEVYKK